MQAFFARCRSRAGGSLPASSRGGRREAGDRRRDPWRRRVSTSRRKSPPSRRESNRPEGAQGLSAFPARKAQATFPRSPMSMARLERMASPSFGSALRRIMRTMGDRSVSQTARVLAGRTTMTSCASSTRTGSPEGLKAGKENAREARWAYAKGLARLRRRGNVAIRWRAGRGVCGRGTQN